METIVEEPEPSTDSSRPLSSKAAEVVHQVEQVRHCASNPDVLESVIDAVLYIVTESSRKAG